MANPLFNLLGGGTETGAEQMQTGAYNNIIARANMLAQNLPSNFNPQAIVQNMLSNNQVTQQQLDQAMRIANQLTGRK